MEGNWGFVGDGETWWRSGGGVFGGPTSFTHSLRGSHVPARATFPWPGSEEDGLAY